MTVCFKCCVDVVVQLDGKGRCSMLVTLEETIKMDSNVGARKGNSVSKKVSPLPKGKSDVMSTNFLFAIVCFSVFKVSY